MRGQSRRVALCGVLCALAEVFLLLGGLVPAALYACPILAMLALLPVREECGVRFALVSWAAVGLLALLLGAWMNGLPFFSRRVKMPEINRER